MDIGVSGVLGSTILSVNLHKSFSSAVSGFIVDDSSVKLGTWRNTSSTAIIGPKRATHNLTRTNEANIATCRMGRGENCETTSNSEGGRVQGMSTGTVVFVTITRDS